MNIHREGTISKPFRRSVERRAREKKKWKEQTRSGSRGTGEKSSSSFLASVATYYRRSHVGAQTTDYRVSSSESPGTKRWETSLGMILLRMNCGANRYGNGRRLRRGLSESHYVNYARRRYCRATFHPARKIRRRSRFIPPANGNRREITMTFADRVYDEDYAPLI